MFDGRDSKDIALFALIGLGLYSQCNSLNLANNTTILLLAFFLFMEHEEVEKTKKEVCCIEEMTGTSACNCKKNNRFGCC